MRLVAILPILLVVPTVLNLCTAGPATAEIRIEGTRDALTVSTGREPIGDVLSTLSREFGIRYRSAIPLDVAAGQTYAGSLLEVTSRLLQSYNYILRRNQDATEVIIVSKRGVVPAPARNTAIKDKGITSRWR